MCIRDSANIIRSKGFRSIYDPGAVFFEYAPPNFRARAVQKVRRGQGLIRVFWDFRRFLFDKQYGKYGMLIFPMEFLMHNVFPSLWLVCVGLFFVSLALFSLDWFFAVLAFIGLIFGLSHMQTKNRGSGKLRNVACLIMSFFSSQVFLFYALILWIFGRSLHKWQKVEDIRRKWSVK